MSKKNHLKIRRLNENTHTYTTNSLCYLLDLGPENIVFVDYDFSRFFIHRIHLLFIELICSMWITDLGRRKCTCTHIQTYNCNWGIYH